MNESQFYRKVERKDDWSFSQVPRKQTREITHSYHKYPAKFIPQLARALIVEYTEQDDFIWDPFCGSGTLNLEAYRTRRHSLGTDISPIAVLISKAKTTPLEPSSLRGYKQQLLEAIDFNKIRSDSFYLSQGVLNGNIPELKKWFSINSLLELGHILWHIKTLPCNRKHCDFALCGFSSILKRASYWLNSSVKAQIDPNKKPETPLFYFKRQLRFMEEANEKFWHEAKGNRTKVLISRHNASNSLRSNHQKMDCIITSPPYLVSYDYSDIFKLSTYFLFYQEDYTRFRRSFIGTLLRKKARRDSNTPTPEQTILNCVSDTGIRRKLQQYYGDMAAFFKNANRYLRSNGQLILVVGDTQFRGVTIPNAYLLTKIALEIGWSLDKVYERLVPVKILPTFRDSATGKFTGRENSNHSESYEKEYILVLGR